MPPNLEFLLLLMLYFIKWRQIVIFNQLGVPQNFFKDLKGAANKKRLKNTALQGGRLIFSTRTWTLNGVPVGEVKLV